MKAEKPVQSTEQKEINPDDVLRRLLAMPPQPKKGKQEKKQGTNS